MNISDISFGSVKYKYAAQKVIPDKQTLSYLDVVSNATGTDVLVSRKEDEPNSAWIVLDDKTAVEVEEKGNANLGEILTRIYNYMISGGLNIFESRAKVNNEVLFPQTHKPIQGLSALAQNTMLVVTNYAAQKGIKLFDAAKTYNRDSLRTLSDKEMQKLDPDWLKIKEESRKQMEEIKQLVQSRGIRLNQSECVIYSDVYPKNIKTDPEELN